MPAALQLTTTSATTVAAQVKGALQPRGSGAGLELVTEPSATDKRAAERGFAL
jgi:hypothetical protein